MSDYYARELAALQRAGRYRQRRLYDPDLIDLASNDYLGLAELPSLRARACERLAREKVHAPKASLLVNGYHPIHANFEHRLCAANGFEAALVMGNGFNANLALIEALVRRGDQLFIDTKYHASGMLATKLVGGVVTPFAHNDMTQLQQQLAASSARRRIIAVEGIYSMDGDLVDPEVFALAERYDALLIVDEAHSSGVVGEHLMGVFDHFDIPVRPRHIKMGTLGKAYGSFGAYVLASAHVIDYLLNRAKPVIYATAPSLFDVLLADEALQYILEQAASLRGQIRTRQQLVTARFPITMDGLIAAIAVGDNRKVMQVQEKLRGENFLVGAIRQPTVERAIIRLIARTSVPEALLKTVLDRLQL